MPKEFFYSLRLIFHKYEEIVIFKYYILWERALFSADHRKVLNIETKKKY